MNNLLFLVGYILPNFMSILYKFMAKISIFLLLIVLRMKFSFIR